jgi:hypothetical protein
LLLPGYKCECIKTALEKGVVTTQTVCLFVERELESACGIKQWITEHWDMPFPPLVHYGELHKLSLVPVDLAYIDLLGNLTRVDLKWIQRELVPNLMPGCDLAFTFSVPFRGNKFIKSALEVVKTKHTDLFRTRIESVCVESRVKEIAVFYEILFEEILAKHSYNVEFLTYKDTVFTMLVMMIRNINPCVEQLQHKAERLLQQSSFCPV